MTGMNDLTTIRRAHDLAVEIAESRKKRLLALKRSAELLETPPPDTFLGRQHHEPIPLPSDSEEE
jgi:hypothetical protein